MQNMVTTIDGLQQLFHVWRNLGRGMTAQGGTHVNLACLTQPEEQQYTGILMEALFSMQLGAECWIVFPIEIDYSLSLPAMIQRGKYDRVDEDNFTDRKYPIKGSGTVHTDVMLLRTGRKLSRHEALEEMKARRVHPARIEHLLAFGARYPQVSQHFHVIALGSGWSRYRWQNGFPGVDYQTYAGEAHPYIAKVGEGEHLYRHLQHWEWDDFYGQERFLVLQEHGQQ